MDDEAPSERDGKLRWLRPVGIALAALLLIVWVRVVTRSALSIYQNAEPTQSVYLSVQDAQVVGRVHGLLRWRVHARSLSFTQDRQTVTAEGVYDGLLYDDASRPVLDLSAGRAVFSTPGGALEGGPDALKAGTLSLTGNITARVRRRDGPTLRGSELTWDGTRQEARAFGETSAQFPPGPSALGDLRLQTSLLIWSARDGSVRAPGTVTAQFPSGVQASGTDCLADTRTGNLSLRRLHITFRVPPGTLTP